ncbi:BZ3500_MvSof-1268-A1-R1_Chr6-3g09013 [Microbotryum saponariae]|uniref:BZ3500_MvSof-1268-A1-R1_Chr6-3g09013 protein n=1 Tax=Microbotryum saponariae TaxID=289078 RepID=A0A2X0KQX0_9BASI|nr:BZ3500_MvSof-1268-A1-R1_Chr6-3g09013 [Microbotryum saponariae]SDA07615.1 BZ3501_MvSof-1269-A2-R1_Chr6-2g08717 [Microbotryum saponariae]
MKTLDEFGCPFSPKRMPLPQAPSSDADSDDTNSDASSSSDSNQSSADDSEREDGDADIDHRRAIKLWAAIHSSHRNATGRMSPRKWRALKQWVAKRYYSELRISSVLGISHARLVEAVKRINKAASKGNAWSRFLSNPVVIECLRRQSKDTNPSKARRITKRAAQLWRYLTGKGDFGSAGLTEDDQELVRAAFAAAQAGTSTTSTSIVPPTIIMPSASDIPSPTRMKECQKYIAHLREEADRMSKMYGVETLTFVVPRFQDDMSPTTKAMIYSLGGGSFAAHHNYFKDPQGNSLLSNFASKTSWDETLTANEASELKEANTRSMDSVTRDVLAKWHGTLFRAQLNSALATMHRHSDESSSPGEFTPQKKMVWSIQGLKALGVKVQIKDGTKSGYEMALHHSADTSPKLNVAQLKAIIDDLRHGRIAVVPSLDRNDKPGASGNASTGEGGPLSPNTEESEGDSDDDDP